MFRAFVAFLAALPLLLPPGMCICRFVPCADCSVPHEEHVTNSSADELTQCSKCSAHRAQPETSTGESATKNSPGHSHQDHAPWCTAITGDADRVATESVSVPTEYVTVLNGYVANFEWATVVPSRSRDFVAASIPSPPLYVSHCALLI